MRLFPLLIAIAALATACGGTNFAGGSQKNATKKEAKPTKEKKEASAEVAEEGEEDEASLDPSDEGDEEDGAEAEEAEGPAASTPENPLDIEEEGFTCLDDMSAADGPWDGTFTGRGLSFTPGNSGNLEVKGTVAFQMKFTKKGVLGITDFTIEGGMQGIDQIRSYEPSMELRCGDGSFEPTEVDHAGHKLTVTLAFTHQSWNPPTLKGTWVARDFLLEWASGTWEVARR